MTRADHMKRIREQAIAKLSIRKCEICGKDFKPKTLNQKICQLPDCKRAKNSKWARDNYKKIRQRKYSKTHYQKKKAGLIPVKPKIDKTKRNKDLMQLSQILDLIPYPEVKDKLKQALAEVW